MSDPEDSSWRGGIEASIEAISFHASEDEWLMEYQRSAKGFILHEYDVDEDGYLTGEETYTVVASLQAEIVDYVATHHVVYGIEITGPSEEQFFRWLRPLLDADQEVVEINGTPFEVATQPRDD